MQALAQVATTARSDQLAGHEATMKNINLAEAKAHLSELVEQAASGDTIYITRRGKPMARLVAVGGPRKPIDIKMLKSVTDASPKQPETAGDFIRRMRDDARY
jgi:prevent-host-death family protein